MFGNFLKVLLHSLGRPAQPLGCNDSPFHIAIYDMPQYELLSGVLPSIAWCIVPYYVLYCRLLSGVLCSIELGIALYYVL